MNKLFGLIICLFPFTCHSAEGYLVVGGGPAGTLIDREALAINNSDDMSKNDYGLSLKGGVGIKLENVFFEGGGIYNDVDFDTFLNDETYSTGGYYITTGCKFNIGNKHGLQFHVGSLNWEAKIDPGWKHGTTEFNGRDLYWGLQLEYKRINDSPLYFEYEYFPLDGIKVHRIGISYYYKIMN